MLDITKPLRTVEDKLEARIVFDCNSHGEYQPDDMPRFLVVVRTPESGWITLDDEGVPWVSADDLAENLENAPRPHLRVVK